MYSEKIVKGIHYTICFDKCKNTMSGLKLSDGKMCNWITLLDYSQESTWKDEEIQMSQKISGLTSELAVLQTEKRDLLQQCESKEVEIKGMHAEVSKLKDEVKLLEASEEKSKKAVEDLEVSLFWRYRFCLVSHIIKKTSCKLH